MSIYPAKNKKGDFTGSWTVEVMRAGKRERATAPDMATAKLIERELEAGRPVPTNLVTPQAAKRQATATAEQAYTLARLEREAGERLKGRKDEKQSAQRLAEMVKLLGPETPVASVKYADLEKAGAALSARGLLPKTINRYMASISGALKWARLNEVIERVPPKPWKPEGRGRITFVPEKDDHRIIQWLLANGRREQATVYEVLVTTGLRISELLSLSVQDIDIEWVRLDDTKNLDARDVPIAPALAESLRNLVRRGNLPSYRQTFDAFVLASETLSLGVRITPHVLRHTAATRLTTARVPTATVKDFLGHRDIRTTLKYAHAEKDALQAAARLLSGKGKTSGQLETRATSANRYAAELPGETGGLARNRTGVQGFAVLCVTTPPRGLARAEIGARSLGQGDGRTSIRSGPARQAGPGPKLFPRRPADWGLARPRDPG